MKKQMFIWSMMVIALMTLSMMLACGGDDDRESSQIVDGVNINGGKKITYLYINISPEYDYGYEFNIQYDLKGRLSKVLWRQKYQGDFLGTAASLIELDYDLRYIQVYNQKEKNMYGYSFTLNEQGYISQIANVAFRYNTEGYLTNVDCINDFWTLSYNDNDISKSLSAFASGKTKIWIFGYGKDSTTGEIIFNMNCGQDRKGSTSKNLNQEVHSVAGFIAYQAGLFGKISKHCSYLSSSSETTAIFNEYIESNLNTLLRCKFVCE